MNGWIRDIELASPQLTIIKPLWSLTMVMVVVVVIQSDGRVG